MPIERKRLFREKVLRNRLSAFEVSEIPDSVRQNITRWAGLIESERIFVHQEKELLPDFVTEILDGLLGYTGPTAGGDTYTRSREQYVAAHRGFADLAIGLFSDKAPITKNYIVAVEGKGPKDPLDRPFGGRPISAVDQAYDYAIGLQCEWILVTNLREVRLYHKGADKRTYELFDIAKISKDDDELKRFVFLLGSDRVVLQEGRCHLDALLEESDQADIDLTHSYYNRYAAIRREALHKLLDANPSVSPDSILFYTQKILDRVLFTAFCEDRGLLPANVLKRAFEQSNPFAPKQMPKWGNFKGLFHSIDMGNKRLKIPAYDGGLFAQDSELDSLNVPDDICMLFKEIGDYDYRSPVQTVGEFNDAGDGDFLDVEILGHIFERSITDLEHLQEEMHDLPKKGGKQRLSRRKREGAFYTPTFVTRFIVEQALDRVLEERHELLRRRHQKKAKGTAVKALQEPHAYDLERLNEKQRKALCDFWESWIEEVKTVRVLDLACGSGAFLLEAFDHLYDVYQQANERRQELHGKQFLLFNPDKEILQNNLYGVDISREAVQICRLSLWIKTARPGKVLTSLDHNIRVGNSIVSNQDVDSRALVWEDAFPEVFSEEGFDVVIGNPPYVRQELLSPIKSYLKDKYQSYHGMADLYVYFYELGLRNLKPGGRLSFIVTNKWMKASYGEPLRRFFSEHAWMESVVDFGHNKQFFEDADVFPSIIVTRKPNDGTPVKTTRVCSIPRDQFKIHSLTTQFEREGFSIKRKSLGKGVWQLEPPEVAAVMDKIGSARTPFVDYVGKKPKYGLKTGLNDAFLIDNEKKKMIVERHDEAVEIIRPYLRGQDIKRWRPEWSELWMIILKSSENHRWPWSEKESDAEKVFSKTYPSIYAHVKPFEAKLKARKDKGRFWWELRSCSYYENFIEPKIIYQEIQFHPSYSFDRDGMFGNNKVFLLTTDDHFLLAILNSPLMWWHNWRYLPHMKDEALTPATFKMESLPIASPSDQARVDAEEAVMQMLAIQLEKQQVGCSLMDWYQVELGIDKPSRKLKKPFSLDSDEFVAEISRSRGRKNPLSVAGLRFAREEHKKSIEPVRYSLAKAVVLERKLSDLVNTAYGLTPEEINIMWRTAPPRMPIRPRDEDA